MVDHGTSDRNLYRGGDGSIWNPDHFLLLLQIGRYQKGTREEDETHGSSTVAKRSESTITVARSLWEII